MVPLMTSLYQVIIYVPVPFFYLHWPGWVLPRPMSLVVAVTADRLREEANALDAEDTLSRTDTLPLND